MKIEAPCSPDKIGTGNALAAAVQKKNHMPLIEETQNSEWS
jgi:hypothetical protein